MKVASTESLYHLKGTLEAQRDDYLKRLHYNRKEETAPSSPFSASFLEGEARAFRTCLESVKRALAELDQIFEEAEDA